MWISHEGINITPLSTPGDWKQQDPVIWKVFSGLMSKEKEKAGTEDETDWLMSPWLWVKEELCQLCPALTQVFCVSLCHGHSHMGQPVLVAFPNQAAPGLTASHSTETARIIMSFGALLPLARCLSFSCIFQLIPMTTMPWTSEAGKWHRVQEWRKLRLSFQPWMLPETTKSTTQKTEHEGNCVLPPAQMTCCSGITTAHCTPSCSEVKSRYFGSWYFFHKFVSLVRSVRNTCAKCWSNVGPAYPELEFWSLRDVVLCGFPGLSSSLGVGCRGRS